MNAPRAERVHIWPQMEGQADEPMTGWFAIRLGKHQPERALRVMHENGLWFVYLDGRKLGKSDKYWKNAFGIVGRERDILTGRVLTEREYKDLLERRSQQEAAGIDPDKPINLNTARAPF